MYFEMIRKLVNMPMTNDIQRTLLYYYSKKSFYKLLWNKLYFFGWYLSAFLDARISFLQFAMYVYVMLQLDYKPDCKMFTTILHVTCALQTTCTAPVPSN